MVVESREWFLSSYAADGVPTSEHLKLRSVKLSLDETSIPENFVGIQLLWISVDPYLRSRMTGHMDGLHFPQFSLGQVISEYGIGRVIGSKDSKFTEGDIVINPFMPLSEYSIVPNTFLRKVDPDNDMPLPEYLNALGIPGLTAWVGIELVGEAKQGLNVFVSAAAGGVGMFAGQLAKLKGCRVIGSTGSNEKVKMLKEELGFDDAFNYHEETDFDAALNKYFPNGIDIYFDNVGGKMLEAVLNNVNKGAKIPLCGMISEYNKAWTDRDGVRNLLNLVGKEVKMQGFIIGSYLNHLGQFEMDMQEYIKAGKIKSKTMINIGIESFLESFASIFSSSNVGKVVIHVAE
ncbi:2-alkenal reductase (NADP(+)-dependent)-like [Impatiens glandulifera]|uniref:2-alkenal reductase (NADP(+)-dependent)-like n=1 Tax=Impatiens glandulifera TaxID=253017 RepID=UPI001FB12F20|nr:2-alkenal reductase (NADP(+)-dependent)-like [Impatiens glandulifera]